MTAAGSRHLKCASNCGGLPHVYIRVINPAIPTLSERLRAAPGKGKQLTRWLDGVHHKIENSMIPAKENISGSGLIIMIIMLINVAIIKHNFITNVQSNWPLVLFLPLLVIALSHLYKRRVL